MVQNILSKDSTWRGCAFARNILDTIISDLPVVMPELNRIVTVQECDARMLKKEQMPVTQKIKN
jgi:hypothetical protein